MCSVASAKLSKTNNFARCKSHKKALDAGFPRHYRRGFRGFPGVSRGFHGFPGVHEELLLIKTPRKRVELNLRAGFPLLELSSYIIKGADTLF